MDAINGWDVTLIVLSGYVAVTSLVRLMRRRRDELIAGYRQQLRRAQRRKMLGSAEAADSAMEPPRQAAS